MINQVLPAMTKRLGEPSSSSPESFRLSTKASSTLPKVERVTASLTRYFCLSGIIERWFVTHCLVLPAVEIQPLENRFGTMTLMFFIATGISSSGIENSGLSSGNSLPFANASMRASSYTVFGHRYQGISTGSLQILTTHPSDKIVAIFSVSSCRHRSN